MKEVFFYCMALLYFAALCIEVPVKEDGVCIGNVFAFLSR